MNTMSFLRRKSAYLEHCVGGEAAYGVCVEALLPLSNHAEHYEAHDVSHLSMGKEHNTMRLMMSRT